MAHAIAATVPSEVAARKLAEWLGKLVHRVQVGQCSGSWCIYVPEAALSRARRALREVIVAANPRPAGACCKTLGKGAPCARCKKHSHFTVDWIIPGRVKDDRPACSSACAVALKKGVASNASRLPRRRTFSADHGTMSHVGHLIGQGKLEEAADIVEEKTGRRPTPGTLRAKYSGLTMGGEPDVIYHRNAPNDKRYNVWAYNRATGGSFALERNVPAKTAVWAYRKAVKQGLRPWCIDLSTQNTVHPTRSGTLPNPVNKRARRAQRRQEQRLKEDLGLSGRPLPRRTWSGARDAAGDGARAGSGFVRFWLWNDREWKLNLRSSYDGVGGEPTLRESAKAYADEEATKKGISQKWPSQVGKWKAGFILAFEKAIAAAFGPKREIDDYGESKEMDQSNRLRRRRAEHWKKFSGKNPGGRYLIQGLRPKHRNWVTLDVADDEQRALLNALRRARLGDVAYRVWDTGTVKEIWRGQGRDAKIESWQTRRPAGLVGANRRSAMLRNPRISKRMQPLRENTMRLGDAMKWGRKLLDAGIGIHVWDGSGWEVAFKPDDAYATPSGRAATGGRRYLSKGAGLIKTWPITLIAPQVAPGMWLTPAAIGHFLAHRKAGVASNPKACPNPICRNIGRNPWYYGYKKTGGVEKFWSPRKPTEQSHGHRYGAVTGPFKKPKDMDKLYGFWWQAGPHTVRRGGKVSPAANRGSRRNDMTALDHEFYALQDRLALMRKAGEDRNPEYLELLKKLGVIAKKRLDEHGIVIRKAGTNPRREPYCRMCGADQKKEGPFHRPKVGPQKGKVICDLCYRGWRSGRRGGEKWAMNRSARRNQGNAGENPRIAHEQIVGAFLAGKSKRIGSRYWTDGQLLRVWGNLVAKKVPGGVDIMDAGWRTLLTKNVLNTVLQHLGGGSIYQQARRWYLSTPQGKVEWTGEWTIPTGGVAANRRRVRRNGRGENLTVADIEQWVNNDEGLYRWWKSSRTSLRTFIQQNRAELESAIRGVLNRPPAQKTWRDYAGMNPRIRAWDIIAYIPGKPARWVMQSGHKDKKKAEDIAKIYRTIAKKERRLHRYVVRPFRYSDTASRMNPHRGRARRNPPIAERWDRLTGRQRLTILGFVGFPDDYAASMAGKPWNKLSASAARALQQGWQTNPRRARRNPPEGWVVTQDGETLKTFGPSQQGANGAYAWLLKYQTKSVQRACLDEGYDIVYVHNGKVTYSMRRDFLVKKNPLSRRESAGEIREILNAREQSIRASRKVGGRDAEKWQDGYAHGVAGTVMRRGPRSAVRAVQRAVQHDARRRVDHRSRVAANPHAGLKGLMNNGDAKKAMRFA